MALTLNGTTGEVFPSWTTATRPASPTAGQTGFNTTTKALETYDGTNWEITAATTSQGTSGQPLLSAGAGAAPTFAALGVSAISATGTPSSSNFLRGDGSWASASTPSTILDTQTFNANGTWNKPATGTYAVVRAWGGGGSGATSTSGAGGRGGGGGGGFQERIFLLSDLTSTVSVTIGSGGAAVSGINNGNNGNATTFGAFLTVGGGGGGTTSATGGGGGGSGTSASGSTAGAAATTVSNQVAIIAPAGFAGAPPTSDSQVAGFITSTANVKNGAGNDGVYGGGAGANSNAANGASTTWGGGGGGGSTSGGASSGGTSTYGGAGGAGAFSGAATAGTQPGGGGGASYNAASGKGGDGRLIVYVY